MDELDLLKQRADTLGIKYSPNIGLDTLKAKIEEALAGNKPSEPEVAVAKTHHEIRHDMQMNQLKLIRLRITNMNPDKKDLQGEIFTVANKFLGTVRKYVPYGEAAEAGYHVPYVIYTQLKARKFLQVKVHQEAGGHTRIEQRWVPEFAIEILEPMTQDELNELARKQAATIGTN